MSKAGPLNRKITANKSFDARVGNAPQQNTAIRSPRRRGRVASAYEAERARPAKFCRQLEFLFLIADIPDANYFARCVLDRVITGHVRLAEDVDFAIE